MRELLKFDLPASVVVTLVAIPLCLGIALASGAPLLAGLIAGVVGGLVVGPLSGSNLMVSGPAAGLTAVVLQATGVLGSWQAFLLAVVLAGVLQVALGLLKWGFVADYVPRSVVRGMLAAIGVLLILKQLPHAVGYDADAEGDVAFHQIDGANTFSALRWALSSVQPAAVVICALALVTLVLFEKTRLKNQKVISGPLAAVTVGVVVNQLFSYWSPGLALTAQHRVTLPTSISLSSIQFLDFSAITNPLMWKVAFTIAAVASLETLLSLDATDRLDPLKRKSSADRELLAQGIGNAVSGLLGGLPITGVIVRSAANIDAGARTRVSAILHGGLLLLAVLLIPGVLNLIPYSALAAVLLVTGYKLAKPAELMSAWRSGRDFFAPFAATIVAIVATDLLTGIAIGLGVGTFFIMKQHARSEGLQPVSPPGSVVKRFELGDQITFLHRVGIIRKLEALEPGSRVEIDARRCQRIDPDVLQVIKEFGRTAVERGIDYRLVGFGGAS
ncbi:MAG: SulP family inorganic anion transporter [Archangiaceae bacterium]|nr:SulP family inorganic anion transporter [Archangiaceae bacterium]